MRRRKPELAAAPQPSIGRDLVARRWRCLKFAAMSFDPCSGDAAAARLPCLATDRKPVTPTHQEDEANNLAVRLGAKLELDGARLDVQGATEFSNAAAADAQPLGNNPKGICFAAKPDGERVGIRAPYTVTEEEVDSDINIDIDMPPVNPQPGPNKKRTPTDAKLDSIRENNKIIKTLQEQEARLLDELLRARLQLYHKLELRVRDAARKTRTPSPLSLPPPPPPPSPFR